MSIFSIFMITVLLSSLLFATNLLEFVNEGYSQKKGGLNITPTVKWGNNAEGNFMYCVYEGTVTLETDLSNIRPYCKDPTTDPSLKMMHAYANDGVDIYNLDQIQTPRGIIKDGTAYSICVQFTPSLPNAGYSFAVGCHTFTNTLGSHIEKPFIDLDSEATFNGMQ